MVGYLLVLSASKPTSLSILPGKQLSSLCPPDYISWEGGNVFWHFTTEIQKWRNCFWCRGTTSPCQPAHSGFLSMEIGTELGGDPQLPHGARHWLSWCMQSAWVLWTESIPKTKDALAGSTVPLLPPQSLQMKALQPKSSTHGFAATQVLVPHLPANYDYATWTVCSLFAVDLFIPGNLKVWDVHSTLARFPYIRHENKAPSSKKIYFKYFFAVEKKWSSLLPACERKPFPSPSTRSVLHLC